jgi:single-stranded-DNA-specific exonuclease
LTEKYYKPAIAISVGETESKASARSVSGFHITDHIRSASSLLLGAGGHAMAAGFTVENTNLDKLTKALTDIKIDPDILVRKQRVDVEIPLELVTWDLWSELETFAPFGLGNPKPVFKTRNLKIDHLKRVGKLSQHAKLIVGGLEAMAFNIADIPNNPVDLTYTIDKNIWNGNEKLQLMVKEVKSTHG